MDLRYLGRIVSRLLIFVVLLALVIDICLQIIADNTNTVSYSDVEVGSLDLSVTSFASIVLSERIIDTDSTGIYLYSVANGEKVSVNGKLADIYPDSSRNRELIEKSDNLSLRLSVLRQAQNLESSFSLASVENSIAELRVRLSECIVGDRIEESRECAERLAVLLDVKKLKNGHRKNYKAEIEALSKEQETLLGSLGKSTGTMRSPAAGYFFSGCDGYEELFGDTSVLSLDYEEMAKALSASPQIDKNARAKLLTDHIWHIIAPVSREALPGFAAGNKYDVEMDGGVYRMTLEKVVSSASAKDAFLIFSYDRMPDNFFPARKVEVKIVYEKNEGYIVPVKCLRQIDGFTGVYALHGSVVKFRAVEVIEVNETYAVCNTEYSPRKSPFRPLSGFDKVIIKGKELYDGKIID